jgi:hypothetical protein
VLHHPLHLSHLAAAAASGFGATSADFLGKLLQIHCSGGDLLGKLRVAQLAREISLLIRPLYLEPCMIYLTMLP